MRRLGALFIAILSCSQLVAQRDEISSGRSIELDGVDDYVDLGNIFDDLNFPFSVSAWVNTHPTATSGPVFVSQDNASIYNGFWFYAAPTAIWIEYGDGRGDGNPAFRRGKRADFPNLTGRWIHVCAIVEGPSDMELFVNGFNVGGYYTGESTLPMDSNFPGDVAKIGYFFTNGSIFRYKGQVDEIRVFNKALSQTEIRETMCKKPSVSEPGLIGYWDFDETAGNVVFDRTVNGYDGTLMNGVQRVYSGAPVGDESVYTYTTNWSGVNLSLTEDTNEITISDINGSPNGVHLYVVRNMPSRTSGLNLDQTSQPYFGAFIADTDIGNTFDLKFYTDGEENCGSFRRQGNHEALWTTQSSAIDNHADRIEVIGQITPALNFSLGLDEALCPMTPRQLVPLNDPTGYSFTWQDGSHQSTFQADTYGTYWVEVRQGCTLQRDTITFEQAPLLDLEIDLGEDVILCPFTPITLSPLDNPGGFTFLWQDGSTGNSLTAERYGEYAVTVKSECAMGSDTIKFTKLEQEAVVPNIFTPNNDSKNETFMIDETFFGSRLSIYNRWGKLVYRSESYRNTWNGAELPTGIYYYLIEGECLGQRKGWVSILR